MNPDLSLDATLALENVNVRLEKNGEEDTTVACDLKLVGSLTLEQMRGLFSTDTAFNALLGNLYNKDGEMVTGDLDTLKLAKEFSKVKVSLVGENDTKLAFKDAEVNKIIIAPLAGRHGEVSMRLQIKPTHEQHGDIAEMLGSLVRIKASGRLKQEDDPKQSKMTLDSGAAASAGTESAATH